VHDLPADYLHYVEQLHENHGYETNYRRLSEALGIRVRPGLINSILPGPPPRMILEPHVFGWYDSRVGRHELAHAVLTASGLEADILRDQPEEVAIDHIERVCRLTSVLLRVPRPVVQRALKRHGETPRAVLAIQRYGRIPLEDALERYVHADPDRGRAAFTSSGNYVTSTAAYRAELPFAKLDRVPDVAAQYPDLVIQRISSRRHLGTYVA